MTNERAIELLHRLQDEQFDGPHGDERREALEMAVKALEGDGDTISRKAVMKEFSDFVRKSNNSDFAPTPTWNDAVSLVGSMPSAQPQSTMGQVNDTVQSTKDCISRQQAIGALWKALYEYEDKTEKQFIDSEELDVADWIQHRNFVQNMSDIDRQTILGLPSAQPDVPDTNVGDMISRQTAIDAIDKYIDKFDCIDANFLDGLKTAKKLMMQLPSAQLECKTGKWTINDCHAAVYKYHCSECGANHRARYDYCPSCGADMRGESE